MGKSLQEINAGTQNATGIEFQKHCALYLLLENYHLLKDKKYFICIEHYDDFLFCYQTSEDQISSIEAYQAKKSTNGWKLTQNLFEVLKKIIDTGESLDGDTIPKTEDYSHGLHFITNNTIHLEIKATKNKAAITSIINETNGKAKYIDLDKAIKEKIQKEVSTLLSDSKHLKQLEYTALVFIDLTRTSKNQVELLIGKFGAIFGQEVHDHKAAVKILLDLFRGVELTFNQGGHAKLLDESKRVNSSVINRAINIITTQQKAYELWKSKKDVIATNLAIPISKQSQFKLDYENSLDLFKDLKQAEHQKILKFIEANKDVFDTNTQEQDCIKELYSKFVAKNNSQLEELQLKAAIYAAYIQISAKL